MKERLWTNKKDGKMKKKILKAKNGFVSIIFMLMISNMIYSQEIQPAKNVPAAKTKEEQGVTVNPDAKQGTTASQSDQKKEQEQKKEEEKTSVKKVKGSNPDMSKAKGARPPYIVRPSGSAIPKGAGKPGGAIKPGRR